MDTVSKLDIDFHEWWTSPLTTYQGIAYIFKFLTWMQNNNIHRCWNMIASHFINIFFGCIITQIFYNYTTIFNGDMNYLLLSLICTFSVYTKFCTSGIAFITIFGKCVEMGSSVVLADNLHRIDDFKDYCKKKDNEWMIHIMKVVIGYNGEINTDGEFMAREVGAYVGTTYEECKKIYDDSYIKTMGNAVDFIRTIAGV